MFDAIKIEQTSNKAVANDLLVRFAFLVGYYSGVKEDLYDLVPKVFSGRTEELDWMLINSHYNAGVAVHADTHRG